MSSTTHFPDPEGFQQQSDNFISWLQATPGVKLNPNLRLADLRASGAGRGVGEYFAKDPRQAHKSAHAVSPEMGPTDMFTSH
jgi:hypothetical protein